MQQLIFFSNSRALMQQSGLGGMQSGARRGSDVTRRMDLGRRRGGRADGGGNFSRDGNRSWSRSWRDCIFFGVSWNYIAVMLMMMVVVVRLVVVVGKAVPG